MELQNFINDNTTDYTSKFKEFNINYKKYSELGLIIVHSKRNYDYDYENNLWISWCRGAIIRISDNKVIALPVKKSSEEINIENTDITINDNSVLTPFCEGTMLNIFYHNEWIISTRSFINAKNKWNDNLSFKKMFDEIINEKNINLDNLNKNCSYSFVIQHKKNRIVTEIVDNNLILIHEFNHETNTFTDLDNINYENFTILKKNDINVLKNSIGKSFNFQFKGFSLENNGKRIKFINPSYKYVHDLKSKANFNNKMMSYLYLRNNDLLSEYLRFFKTDTEDFNKYRNILYIFKNELYDCYVKYFIKKTIDKKDVPYHIKPFIYDLHTIYKQEKIKINNEVVNEFLYKLPIKRITFALNYYIT